ncbi:unnamed protein product [Pocillopora meandrina]|nr:unnamed protein product [Pocillopora meandrina]
MEIIIVAGEGGVFHLDDETNTETSGGNQNVLEDMLQHANSDQINTVTELALILLENQLPFSPPTAAKLKH